MVGAFGFDINFTLCPGLENSSKGRIRPTAFFLES